jgi:hypothetical protein
MDYKQKYEDLVGKIKILQVKYDENGYDCTPDIMLQRIDNFIDTISKQKPQSEQWEFVSMYELIALNADECKDENVRKVLLSTKLPTRRWGHITTEFATSDKQSLERYIEKFKAKGITCKIVKDKELSAKHKGYTMYNLKRKK